MDDRQMVNNKPSDDERQRDATKKEHHLGDSAQENLVGIIEGIDPSKLKYISHPKYVANIVQIAARALECDSTCLLYLQESVKGCTSPCFKRDILLEVINDLLKDSRVFNALLHGPFDNNNKVKLWRELAMSIVSLPELFTNCGALGKFPQLIGDVFYKLLIDKVYEAIEFLAAAENSTRLRKEHKMLLLQILGRVSISGQSQKVWEQFTYRAIKDDRHELRLLISDILTLAFETESTSQYSITFEIFLDHLHLIIIHNLKPAKDNGNLIKSILGDGLLRSELFQYLLCDKSIFKTNFNLDRRRQSVILFNSFAYLSSLVNHDASARNCSDGSLLIKTLLEIVQSWSNITKVLLRVYEHNRYITCALLIAFRYALEHDRSSLIEYSNEIQSMIVRAMPIYLNRASFELRDLAMCLGQLLLPILHELIAETLGKGNEQGEDVKLNFDIQYNDDLLHIEKLFREDIDVLFTDSDDLFNMRPGNNLTESAHINDGQLENTKQPKIIQSLAYGNDAHVKSGQAKSLLLHQQGQGGIREEEPKRHNRDGSTNKTVVELDGGDDKIHNKEDDNEDDLKPYDPDDDFERDIRRNEDEEDEPDTIGEDSANVPIYLSDCINGLIENSNRRYVKLCLVRSGELISQMIDYEKSRGGRSIDIYRLNNNNSTSSASGELNRPSSSSSDNIRDVAIELTKVLLYLDNQFNIADFDAYRMKALVSMCVAAPELVAKYLVEEFNASSKGMGHQLDILRALVASAQYLSEGSIDIKSVDTFCDGIYRGAHEGQKSSAWNETAKGDKMKEKKRGKINKFAKYGSLYFYGIVYRLKADFNDKCGDIIISQPKAIIGEIKREEQRSGLVEEGQGKMIMRREDRRRVLGRQGKGGINDDGSISAGVDLECTNDDSYLLSRILYSISIIISCLSQQPITCKLSGDLIDILAAYRCHPDPGVQSAITGCLKAIKDSTPSVYYSCNLEQRMLHLFGAMIRQAINQVG